MISISSITLQRGRQVLLEKTSLTIHNGTSIALIGQNGCGKSSLFALILQQVQTEHGEVKLPSGAVISHMAQEVADSERTALDHVLDGHREFRRLEQEIERALTIEDYDLLAKLYEQFEIVGGYNATHEAAKLLHGLGFTSDQHGMKVTEFSGGWRIRLNLAQALMCPSDIMLLDEPTNHLDLDATIWLEKWLRRYPGTLLLISHDRDFIDNVSDEIVHIENAQLNLYKGNYSAFERQRGERLALQQSTFEKQQREIKHLQSFITRFKAQASKAKQAQSRVKQLDSMETIAKAQVDSPFNFRFEEASKMSNPLVGLGGVDLGYGDKTILSDVKFDLHPGARIGLLGVNGAGKSTLIKALTGDLIPQSGQVVKGENCAIGYFAQHQLEALDFTSSALTHIQRLSPGVTEQKIRGFLGGFDFHGDKAVEPIKPFSGGEKARLALAMIVWQKPNLLLLDEPTNHLDLDMRSALTMALQQFDGALVVVSHDRHLLRNSVDEFYLVDDGHVGPFEGTLETYHKWLNDKQTQEKSDLRSKGKADKADKTASVEKAPKLEAEVVSTKQQRQEAAEKRKQAAPILNQVKKLERKIEKGQADLAEVEAGLIKSDIYQAENKSLLDELLAKQISLSKALEEDEAEWLDLSEKLEGIV